MPEFLYQGVNQAGKDVSGKLEAPSEGDLRIALRGMGIRPTSIKKDNVKKGNFFSKIKSVPVDVLIGFTRQLQVLIGAGIPIVQSLDLLHDQAGHLIFKGVIRDIRDRVSGGSYFWEALSIYPMIFPKLYISLVRAGEASGSIDQMLKRLTRYLEDGDRLRKIVKSAMMYPIIVVAIGVGVVTLMLIFVIPKFEDMLKSNGQALPVVTQWVISSSHFLIDHILLIVGSFMFFAYLSAQYLKTEEGRSFWDRLMFRVPLFGQLAQKAGIARFSRTLQTLLASGVNLVDAVDICKSTIDHVVLEEAISKIRGEIEAGKTLGTVISKLSIFPKMAIQMIMVGEATGSIDKMLEKIADFYESEVEIFVSGLTKLIEPIVLVVLGSLVGGILIAMYLPSFSLFSGM